MIVAITVIRDPLSGREFTAAGGNRMMIYTETGSITLSLPVSPREISYSGVGGDWVEAERSGELPLLLRKGLRLNTLQFSTMLTAKNSMFVPQSNALNAIKALAGTKERVLIKYSAQEAGLWRVMDIDYDSQLRHPDTDEPTRLMVSMSFKRASDAAPAVGPVSGGPKPPASAPKPAPQRTHTVVKGDTLWGIAQRYYGNGTQWPRIYDANRSKIKDPHWIFPGQVFVIP